MLPVDRRVAVFDLDGTLWCEKPHSPLMGFLLAELGRAVERRPGLAQRPEYRAALDRDGVAIGRLGAVNVVLALVELHAGLTPEAFETRVREHVAAARHPERGVPLSQTRYRPMLELIAELRARDFSVYAVAGSGVEFVRVVSERYFGISPEGVVGAQVGYELAKVEGRPSLLRTRELLGDPNEGAAKAANVQRLLGRRPILAAGDSAGDAELLDYASAAGGPSLALLVEHDDAKREYAYPAWITSASAAPAAPVATIARQRGWTPVSMRDDWEAIYANA
jgi:phosphoserine phosphatase